MGIREINFLGKRWFQTERLILRKFQEGDEHKVNEMTDPGSYELFKSFSKRTIDLIFKEEIPVGWIHLHLPDNSLGSGFVYIYVAPDHRRQGIGAYAYSQAESQLKEIGCNWWSSYPESEAADQFAIAVGFDYTNTNSCLVHNGSVVNVCMDGIRMCRMEDYPAASDIWSREYAAMHIRLGLPYKRKELSAAERKADHDDFCQNISNYFVLESDHKIVGVGSLFDDNSGIGSLAVDSDHSGRGYGTRLAVFLTNECIRRGCPRPCLYCEAGNDNAMHLYKKIGYVEQSRESIAVKN